jgi:RimJ/RimL family protein N-acetyltransferase
VSTGTVHLREVAADDLDVFFLHQQDTKANDLAKVYPRDRDDFNAHWDRIRNNPDVIARTIVHEDRVAGNINTFEIDGQRFIGYWIGQDCWGRGIASQAVAQMLKIDPHRPLRAYVAAENIGSIRALQRSGFVKIGEHASAGDARFMACVEVVYELR